MNDLQPINKESNLPQQLDIAKQALQEATDDWRRKEIRDSAKLIEIASEILKRKDIQVQAANLVQDAERTIAKANPPKERGGDRRSQDFNVGTADIENPISRQELSDMRKAHKMSDDEYEQAKQESIENETPLTRHHLQNYSKNKHLGFTSGFYEWYTPKEYIDAVREVLGEINLDPATSEKANQTVQADKIYTEQDNGLDKHWTGKVFMNPPFKSKLIKKFVPKLIEHYKNGDITEAILLTDSATETDWYQKALETATSYCYPKGRLKFYDPNDQTQNAQRPQTFFYFGNTPNKFYDVFSKKGFTKKDIQLTPLKYRLLPYGRGNKDGNSSLMIYPQG